MYLLSKVSTGTELAGDKRYDSDSWGGRENIDEVGEEVGRDGWKIARERELRRIRWYLKLAIHAKNALPWPWHWPFRCKCRALCGINFRSR